MQENSFRSLLSDISIDPSLIVLRSEYSNLLFEKHFYNCSNFILRLYTSHSHWNSEICSSHIWPLLISAPWVCSPINDYKYTTLLDCSVSLRVTNLNLYASVTKISRYLRIKNRSKHVKLLEWRLACIAIRSNILQCEPKILKSLRRSWFSIYVTILCYDYSKFRYSQFFSGWYNCKVSMLKAKCKMRSVLHQNDLYEAFC